MSRISCSFVLLLALFMISGCGSSGSKKISPLYTAKDEQAICGTAKSTNQMECEKIYGCLKQSAAPYSDVQYMKNTPGDQLQASKISLAGRKCLVQVAAQAQASQPGGGSYKETGAEKGFVSSCTDTGNGTSSGCQKAYRCLETSVKFADYLAFTQALAAGTDPADRLDSATLQKIKTCLLSIR
jgi:hypothetical protein